VNFAADSRRPRPEPIRAYTACTAPTYGGPLTACSRQTRCQVMPPFTVPPNHFVRIGWHAQIEWVRPGRDAFIGHRIHAVPAIFCSETPIGSESWIRRDHHNAPSEGLVAELRERACAAGVLTPHICRTAAIYLIGKTAVVCRRPDSRTGTAGSQDSGTG